MLLGRQSRVSGKIEPYNSVRTKEDELRIKSAGLRSKEISTPGESQITAGGPRRD